MTETTILYFGMFCFGMAVIGIILTILEFKRL